MQSISLSDYVTVKTESGDGRIMISCSDPRVPVNDKNTAYIAARHFIQAAGLSPDIHIDIKKIIPVEAGLAGGSTDAAAVLYALDIIFPDVISRDTLYRIAAATGADVPFCLRGGTVFCQGIGELLTDLEPLSAIPLVLVKPAQGLRTAQIFQDYSQVKEPLRPDNRLVLQAVASRNIRQLAETTANVLEPLSIVRNPEIGNIKEIIKRTGAAPVLMSGSGPTIFGFYENEAARDRAIEEISKQISATAEIISAKTLTCGLRIIADKLPE